MKNVVAKGYGFFRGQHGKRRRQNGRTGIHSLVMMGCLDFSTRALRKGNTRL